MANCKTWVAIWVAFLVAAALGVAPALAQEKKQLLPGNFSTNFGLYSDYTFRGISQTGNDPAVQGSIDWSIDTSMHGIGIYAGAWGSNVNLTDGDLEIDFYGGLTKTFGPVNAKAGFIYYRYPGARGSLNFDYVEGTVALSGEIYPGLTLGVSYNGSPNNFGDSGDAHYFNGGLSYAVPVKEVNLTLFGNVGRQMIQRNAVFGTPDYWDFKVGATLGLTKNLSLSAFYTDTDIDTAECSGGLNTCDGRFQASLVAAF
ncbi:MAG TPA: TorF family putative porin [Rhodospirillales bacterium]|jgi:uncharacterized protein (TIGR02001 family)